MLRIAWTVRWEASVAMSFFMLVLKNVLRQRARTALTVVGISVGIMTVVTLGIVTDGMKATMADIMRAGGADFMVAQKGAADLSFSSVPEDEWRAIAVREDVAWAHGVLMHIVPVSGNPFFVVSGVRPEDLAESPPEVLAGRLLAPGATDEVVLGERAAQDLAVRVGERVTIDNREFQVVGIVRTGETWQDAGAYVPLVTAQAMARRPGVVTAVYVKVAPGESIDQVAAAIEEQSSQVVAIRELADYGDVDQGAKIIDALNLAISVLAVGIGAIGVMNTMVMSVFERTREIGILRAVGWSGQRILRMIVTESLLLCLIAAGFGVLLGMLATRGVMLIQTVQALMKPDYLQLDILLRGLVVAFVVAIAGAIYPAIRAVRLKPMEALRYE